MDEVWNHDPRTAARLTDLTTCRYAECVVLGRYLAVALILLASSAILSACGSAGSELQVVASTPVATRGPQVPTPAPTPAAIKVYVTGAVARPGVYALSPDSRIEDAVAAAGGFVDGADMVRVNLAARVRDEQEIFVPKVGQPAPAEAASASVNLNSASATQLHDSLGLSTTLARKIVTFRNKNGPFASVDDLKKVPVPAAQLERIRNAVTTR
ncbi:MAG: ComEA family DNA-binding protein [Chloroflexota bacterium]|nr:ComEA family DNA-binding protein [Chloroflexota bacterium]